MVFKLVRIDTPEPCKIQLTVGKHVIGRGKFLHNDETDKRVSRNHAELEVTLDTVKLKSLHQNPCFFIKKSIETHLLHQDTIVCLCHGDKFGLLPDHFWYEVIHCPDQDSIEERSTIFETTENGVHNDEEHRMNQAVGVRELGNGSSDNSATADKEDEGTISDDSRKDSGTSANSLHKQVIQCDVITTEGSKLIITNSNNAVDSGDRESVNQIARVRDQGNGSCDASAAGKEESAINFDVGAEEADAVRSTSPSLLRNAEEGAATQATTDTSIEEQVTKTADPVTVKSEVVDQDTEPYDPPAQQSSANTARSPAKREHSSTESSPVDVKKVKIERDDTNTAAGPSNDQQASSDTSKDNPAPASPAKPAPLPRERCIYGASCYRRNPQHKAQFSHPSDADWGTDERGVCPYGAACRRRDPRHWSSHTHPPGTVPPAHGPRPGNRQRRRQRNVSVSDDDVADSSANNLIVTGKRARKTVHRQDWCDADSDEDKDPYGTDESDEWQPPSDATNSQNFSQDF